MYIRTEGDVTCPHCYIPLIELAKFDARDDIEGLDRGDWGPRYNQYSEISFLGEALQRLTSWFSAGFKQRRLNRIRRQFPRALYCSACGYILRR